MDKEKIMNLVGNISNNSYNAGWIHADDTENNEGFKQLEIELDSKPVMPKVFDDFASQFNLKEQQGDKNLDGALSELYFMYMRGGSRFQELEDYMRSTLDEEFYAKCVNALVNDYEVEK